MSYNVACQESATASMGGDKSSLMSTSTTNAKHKARSKDGEMIGAAMAASADALSDATAQEMVAILRSGLVGIENDCNRHKEARIKAERRHAEMRAESGEDGSNKYMTALQQDRARLEAQHLHLMAQTAEVEAGTKARTQEGKSYQQLLARLQGLCSQDDKDLESLSLLKRRHHHDLEALRREVEHEILTLHKTLHEIPTLTCVVLDTGQA